MKTLTFIWHDCFFYSDENLNIVFDYWQDIYQNGELPEFLLNADKNKPLYILVSHHHKDHYTKDIFDWERYFNDIHFIISKDVYRFSKYLFKEDSTYQGFKPSVSKVTVLSKGMVYRDENIEIKAYGSTDTGNSYSIETGGLKLFHAGDLNAWIWKDESTQGEVKQALGSYRKIVDEIKRENECFDLVMFPVDSRIGTDYFTGAKIFAEEIDCRHFFPMHFSLGDEEERIRHTLDACRIKDYANPTRGEYICLTSPYSTFSMP